MNDKETYTALIPVRRFSFRIRHVLPFVILGRLTDKEAARKVRKYVPKTVRLVSVHSFDGYRYFVYAKGLNCDVIEVCLLETELLFNK